MIPFERFVFASSIASFVASFVRLPDLRFSNIARFVCASFALRFVLRWWPPSFEASDFMCTRLVHSSSLNNGGRGNMSGGGGRGT